MSAAEAGAIGRDLILRKERLFTEDFKLAAWLASDGTAGNDGFMDFADCVTILPEERYSRIAGNPDELIDDEVSANFGEFYFVSRVANVFDEALVGERNAGFLHYLVLGGEDQQRAVHGPWSVENAVERFPRLYAKYGHLLSASRPQSARAGVFPAKATLDDLIS